MYSTVLDVCISLLRTQQIAAAYQLTSALPLLGAKTASLLVRTILTTPFAVLKYWRIDSHWKVRDIMRRLQSIWLLEGRLL